MVSLPSSLFISIYLNPSEERYFAKFLWQTQPEISGIMDCVLGVSMAELFGIIDVPPAEEEDIVVADDIEAIEPEGTEDEAMDVEEEAPPPPLPQKNTAVKEPVVEPDRYAVYVALAFLAFAERITNLWLVVDWSGSVAGWLLVCIVAVAAVAACPLKCSWSVLAALVRLRLPIEACGKRKPRRLLVRRLICVQLAFETIPALVLKFFMVIMFPPTPALVVSLVFGLFSITVDSVALFAPTSFLGRKQPPPPRVAPRPAAATC